MIYNGNMSKELLQGREVIIEFHTVGAFVKVTAMDVQSLVEVSIQGPKTAPEQMLKQNALRRLAYVLKRDGVL